MFVVMNESIATFDFKWGHLFIIRGKIFDSELDLECGIQIRISKEDFEFKIES